MFKHSKQIGIARIIISLITSVHTNIPELFTFYNSGMFLWLLECTEVINEMIILAICSLIDDAWIYKLDFELTDLNFAFNIHFQLSIWNIHFQYIIKKNI